MFNILTVLVLLPLEVAVGYLEYTSGILVGPLQRSSSNTNTKEPEMLNAITKPLTDIIIQIDKAILDKIATNETSDDVKLIKKICKKGTHSDGVEEAGFYNDSVSYDYQSNTSLSLHNTYPCKLV